ncbi:MAG: IPExxxVDY family protein [Cytophagales bacterium]
MKAQKLIFDYDYDFVLVGLVSSVKEFKLAWYINQFLGIDLAKCKELEYDFLKDCKISISNFIFETEYSSFRLLKNRSVAFINTTKPYLLPELKNYDYFALLNGSFADYYIDNIKKLNEIPIVELVRLLEVQKIKDKENLLIN